MSVTIIVILIIVLAIGLAVWAVKCKNNLIALRNRVGNGWAQIDVLLKQRSDLIPNLVNCVKGYAGHESNVLTAVTNARSHAITVAADPNSTKEQRAEAEAQVTRGITNLIATAEAYPDLKSNQNFIDLQNQLTSMEQKIAYARQFYNDVVMKYNTARESFPTSLMAGGFQPAQYFNVTEADRIAPTVDFSSTPQVQF